MTYLLRKSQRTDQKKKKKEKLEVLNNYSKITKYKVNIPKSTGFLFSSNNQFELEM